MLYDASTIDLLKWPESFENEITKKYLIPLIKEGSHTFFGNVRTTLAALHVDDMVLPITINETEYDNCYVCSPYGQYVAYAKETVAKFHNPLLRFVLKGTLSFLDIGFRMGKLNKVIFINNWLFTTNLHPPLSKEQIEKIQRFLYVRFPDHALAFRSITAEHPLYEPLYTNGFKMIPSRPIFLFDPTKEEIFQTRIMKSDLRLLSKTDYTVIDGKELTDSDIPRLLELYQSLYLKKYSPANLHLKQEFLSLAIKNKTLHIKALRKNYQIDAVVGFFIHHGRMVTPLFGYDPKTPKEAALYRLLNVIANLEAKKAGVLFNQSSGAGEFKTLRRATPTLEFIAIDISHLNLSRKLPWKILRRLMETVGAPLMTRLDGLLT